MSTLLALPLVVAALGGSTVANPPAAADITWEVDYEAGRARAAAEQRVMLIAVHADKEARSEAFWKKVYKDKGVRASAEDTVNLLACRDATTAKRCDCAKQGGLDSEQAKFLEAALREEILAANADGIVASPQHVWLDSSGKLLLSVPFEMDAQELTWCFAEARRLAGGEAKVPKDARPPRRLLYGECYQPPDEDTYGRGLRPDEVEELLTELRSSSFGGGRGAGGGGGGWGRQIQALAQLAFTAEEEAQQHVAIQLGGGWMTWGGNQVLVSALHTLGAIGPVDAWETLESYLGNKDAAVRNEVAVAIEQIGIRDALKLVKTTLRKEVDPGVQKNWLRALGAIAGEDKAARKTLLDFSEDEDPALRRNAVFALGWLPQNEDVRERLMAVLDSTDGDDIRAAACAMALSRSADYLPVLQKRTADESLPEAAKSALEAAVAVIEGASLKRIETAVREACRDRIQRERVFFDATPARLPGVEA
ncbi:MAG: HEAT repeat domain-containing protein, partial [Planctomycetota bacterium]|nr:HEAT repeat domain-containing protein [Planctomycetota bacterium]